VGSGTVDVLRYVDASVDYYGEWVGSEYRVYWLDVEVSSDNAAAYNIGVDVSIDNYEDGSIQPAGQGALLLSKSGSVPSGGSVVYSVDYEKNERGYVSWIPIEGARLRIVLRYGNEEKEISIDL
jgi:hypothetical protein